MNKPTAVARLTEVAESDEKAFMRAAAQEFRAGNYALLIVDSTTLDVVSRPENGNRFATAGEAKVAAKKFLAKDKEANEKIESSEWVMGIALLQTLVKGVTVL